MCVMPYNLFMSSDTQFGDPGYERELDSLIVYYGSEAFTRSILEVYLNDCPAALTRLVATMAVSDLEAARHAIHSLANIMGVVGPASSRPIIESITADLNDGRLDAAARNAKVLESMVQAVLASIRIWLDDAAPKPTYNDRRPKGDA